MSAPASWLQTSAIATSCQAGIDAVVKDSVETGFVLYQIDEKAVAEARPNVIVTQDLCSVCAPTSSDVATALLGVCGVPSNSSAADSGTVAESDDTGRSPTSSSGGAAGRTPGACSTAADSEGMPAPVIISLEPEALVDVADSCVTVGRACRVLQRGIELRDWFLGGLQAISDAVGPTTGLPEKKVYILEWTDPPFDAGNWVPEILQVAQGRIDDTSCSEAARSGTLASPQPRWGSIKSKRVTWGDVIAADPDVVIVSCCGFDFSRNVKDGRTAVEENPALKELRAMREGRFFAADGNRYLAKSGPSLVQATAIVAAILWYSDAKRSAAIAATGLLPQEGVDWGKIDLA